MQVKLDRRWQIWKGERDSSASLRNAHIQLVPTYIGQERYWQHCIAVYFLFFISYKNYTPKSIPIQLGWIIVCNIVSRRQGQFHFICWIFRWQLVSRSTQNLSFSFQLTSCYKFRTKYQSARQNFCYTSLASPLYGLLEFLPLFHTWLCFLLRGPIARRLNA